MTANAYVVDAATLSAQRALNVALALAQGGYHLVPVTIRRRADGRKSPKFHTGWSWGGTTDPDRIRAWFADYMCSYAICHETSGTEAGDLDPKDGGFGTWAVLGLPASAHAVDTPSGGLHYYWRRDGQGIGTNAGKIGPGVDARSVGGVTFAPGSFVLGLDGDPEPAGYVGDLPPVVELEPTPDAVVRAFAEHRKTEERVSDGSVVTKSYDWVVAAYSEQLARVRAHDPVTMTGFSAKLLGAAMMLGRGVVRWPERALIERLEDACRHVWGSVDDDDRDKIRRGMRDGLARERWEIIGGPGWETEVPTGQEEPAEAHERAVQAELKRLRAQHDARRLFAQERAPEGQEPASTALVDLLAEPEEPEAFRIDRLWPIGGKVLMAAPQKAGKTTMVMNLVRCLADGDPFLAKPVIDLDDWKVASSGFRVTPLEDGQRVFLLDFEMTRRLLRTWFRRQRVRHPDRVHVELMRGRSWDIRDDDVRAEWAAYLRSLGTAVLVVDPIGPVLHGLGIDENSNTDIGGFLAALDKLCREAGVQELFVVHHAGHGAERARGASSFLGWPDANWRLVREELGPLRAFTAEGRDVYLEETALQLEDGRLFLGEGDRAAARLAGAVGDVVELVRDKPGLSVRKLKLALLENGMRGERAQNAIGQAVEAKVIHAHKVGVSLLHYSGADCESCPTVPS